MPRSAGSAAFILLGLAAAGFGQQASETSRLETLLPALRRPFDSTVLSNRYVGSLEAVQRYSVPDTFGIGTAQSLFHTDNAFWTKTNRQASLAWSGAFWGTWIPYSTRQWIPKIGVEYDVYRYEKVTAADFNALWALASSRLYPGRGSRMVLGPQLLHLALRGTPSSG